FKVIFFHRFFSFINSFTTFDLVVRTKIYLLLKTTETRTEIKFSAQIFQSLHRLCPGVKCISGAGITAYLAKRQLYNAQPVSVPNDLIAVGRSFLSAVVFRI